MMGRVSDRARLGTPVELATDGHTTRIVASPSSGGTKPATACPLVIVPIRCSRPAMNSTCGCHYTYEAAGVCQVLEAIASASGSRRDAEQNFAVAAGRGRLPHGGLDIVQAKCRPDLGRKNT